MSLQLRNFASGGGIPQMDDRPVAGGCQQFAIARECDRDHHVNMIWQRRQRFAGLGVPEDHGAILAAGGEETAVLGISEAGYGMGVAFEDGAGDGGWLLAVEQGNGRAEER